MTRIRAHLSAVLLCGLALGANSADAQDLGPYLQGDMRGLQVHATPEAISSSSFTHVDGGDFTLADFQGRYVLLNFWATWCAPCREEMPALNALQQALGGDRFEVVTLATGRNPEPAIRRFFEEEAITDLPMYLDPMQVVARDMGVFGLPITVILDPEGQEIARLRGDADWAADEALALIGALIEAES